MNKNHVELYSKIIGKNIDAVRADLGLCRLGMDEFALMNVERSLKNLESNILYLFKELFNESNKDRGISS